MFFFHRPSNGKYHLLKSIESGKNHGELSATLPGCHGVGCSKSWRRDVTVRLLWIVAITGWLASIGLAVVVRGVYSSMATDAYCLKKTSYFCKHKHINSATFSLTFEQAPLLDEIPVALIELTTKGTFDLPSPFRGEPSDSVDQAWRKIHPSHPLNISIDDAAMAKLTSRPETAARNAPELGGGLFVLPEYTHHLHCVDLLRKVSFFKFAYYQANHDFDIVDDENLLKTHIDHCIEVLRQFVMCHADVGLVTSQWVTGHDNPWPDFNTKKICRNFDGILEWTSAHEFPIGTPMAPVKPPGTKSLELPP